MNRLNFKPVEIQGHSQGKSREGLGEQSLRIAPNTGENYKDKTRQISLAKTHNWGLCKLCQIEPIQSKNNYLTVLVKIYYLSKKGIFERWNSNSAFANIHRVSLACTPLEWLQPTDSPKRIICIGKHNCKLSTAYYPEQQLSLEVGKTLLPFKLVAITLNGVVHWLRRTCHRLVYAVAQLLASFTKSLTSTFLKMSAIPSLSVNRFGFFHCITMMFK